MPSPFTFLSGVQSRLMSELSQSLKVRSGFGETQRLRLRGTESVSKVRAQMLFLPQSKDFSQRGLSSRHMFMHVVLETG